MVRSGRHMKRPRATLRLLALLGAMASLAPAAQGQAQTQTAKAPVPASEPTASPAEDPEALEITALHPDSRFDYDFETGTATLTNGVQVTYQGSILSARKIRIDEATGEAEAEGGVNLSRGGQIWIGESLRYNFRSGAMQAEAFKLGMPPAFLGGERAVTLEPVGTNRVLRLDRAFVTTDDLAEPGYRIQARSMTLKGDRRVVARDAVLYLGNTPVFWFPYYTRQLGYHRYRWLATPGYRSLYGAYARASLEIDLTPQVTASLHADPFSRRGVGLGPSIQYDLEDVGQGQAGGYWIADSRPGTDPTTGQPIDPQRERITFDHRITLRPGLTATAVLRQQSDSTVIRDFFEEEYRRNPLPGSHLEVQQAWPDFTLNLLTRPQVNDFFETTERLPDLKLSAHRQRLGSSPLFYEGENSVGWFQHRFAEGSLTNDFSAVRADSLHQVLLPGTYLGWLNVTPRVGGRATYYGETHGDGWENLGSRTRAVFNTGAEVSLKAHRLWQNASNRFWDVDGVRHIIEPSFNYVYTPEPDARPLELPQFDTELPSLRPLPLNYPDFNSIDSVDSQNTVRLGVRNKIQTKRAGRVEDLLDWAVITDCRLDPREGQQTFSDVYSEADFKPRRWLTFNSEMRFDPSAGLLRESQTSAILKPNTDWSIGVTHRYTRDDLVLGRGGNLLGTRLYLRFSENWGFRATHFYEVRDQILQEQYYTVYRDLRSFTGALTLRWRESLNRQDDDFTVAFSISLKAFPRFKRGQDAERPELLIGG